MGYFALMLPLSANDSDIFANAFDSLLQVYGELIEHNV